MNTQFHRRIAPIASGGNSLKAVLLCLTVSLPLLSQHVGVIERHLAGNEEAVDIVEGPDGALWFTDGNGSIGRSTGQGAPTEYPVPTPGSGPQGIANGPDGALWFTELYGNKIGRITTAGVISEYAIPTADSRPYGIAKGPDGALWFTESANLVSKIGRITPAGVITEFPTPTPGSSPQGITTGPDGALWFTEYFAYQIGRVTTEGTFVEYPSGEFTYPLGITAGPDGALWFTDFNTGAIGRITTSGLLSTYQLPDGGNPSAITTGPDGALWFTTGDNLGSITVAGNITIVASPDLYETGITLRGKSLWLAGPTALGQAIFQTAELTLNPATASPGTPVTLTGSGFEPGESVNLYSDAFSLSFLKAVPADSSGSVQFAYTLGAGPGPYYAALATGASSRKSGVAPLTLAAISVLAPNSGAPGTQVTVKGYGFVQNDPVTIYWYANDAALGSVQPDGNGSFELSLTIPSYATAGPNIILGYQKFGSRSKTVFTVE